MRRWLGFQGMLAGLALLAADPVCAMQFDVVVRDDGTDAIVARGPIVSGDVARLAAVARSRPSGSQFSLIALDSPGGQVDEGLALAGVIHASRLTVLIPAGAKCASMCFFLFAASPVRFAAADALIGVHSASQPDGETVLSKARTTELARQAGAYGVPAEIVGIMVQARPGQMEWLTPHMLASMDVRSWPGGGKPGRPIEAKQSVQIGPSVPSASLTQLAPDPVVARPDPALAASGLTFHGALFCRQGVRHLALQLGETLDRGTLSFWPGAASRDGLSGSLLVEGRLDPSTVSVRPTAWVSREGDVAMVGLSGRSEDGGTTFHGHVNIGLECTDFTMKRIR